MKIHDLITRLDNIVSVEEEIPQKNSYSLTLGHWVVPVEETPEKNLLVTVNYFFC